MVLSPCGLAIADCQRSTWTIPVSLFTQTRATVLTMGRGEGKDRQMEQSELSSQGDAMAPHPCHKTYQGTKGMQGGRDRQDRLIQGNWR